MSNPFQQQPPVAPAPVPPAPVPVAPVVQQPVVQPVVAQPQHPPAAVPASQPTPTAMPTGGDPLGDPGPAGGNFYSTKDHVGRHHIYAGISLDKLENFPFYNHGDPNDPCAVAQLVVSFDEQGQPAAFQQVMIPQRGLTNQLTSRGHQVVVGRLLQPGRGYDLKTIDQPNIREWLMGWLDANVPGWRQGNYDCAIAAPPSRGRDDDDGF